MLIVISGSSGSGKNTVIHEIQKHRPDVKIMKSCTTRKKRDKNDDAYYFLSEEEFKQKILNNEFFEFEEVHKGIYYGILKSSVENVIGKDVYMKDVDVKGSVKLKETLGEDAKLVYLDVPKEILRERILKRGESEESANLRLSRYEFEKGYADEYDLIISNESIEQTAKKIIEEFEL